MSMIKIKKDALSNNILKDESIISFEKLKDWVRKGTIIHHFLRYQEAHLVTYNIAVLNKPFLTGVLLRMLSYDRCLFEDENGVQKRITFNELLRMLRQYIVDLFKRNQILKTIEKDIEILNTKDCAKTKKCLTLSDSPVYLRTDLCFGVRSGGSIGHIAGVLNNLDNFTGMPLFMTTDIIPTVRKDILTKYFQPPTELWNCQEMPGMVLNITGIEQARNNLKGIKPAFIYQRYSLNNYIGLTLASEHNVPFILEYNGSEIWINRNWGQPLKYEQLSEQIERLNLMSADLIVVVSRPMYDELVARGISSEKILINPNGVNPDMYSSDLKGENIRIKYGLQNKIVLGFIGTFGRWHGAEVLTEAFGKLLKRNPAYQDTVRLLMIGDGYTMPLVKEAIDRYNICESIILTGTVPQKEGPNYLAACDILVSPHVPNPDGTPFFGSPTKLFEYMAMGKGIVASNLDQIGDILEDKHTALMVTPGDSDDLARGLEHLIEDKELRLRLGQAARQKVVAKFTWKEHTRKIIAKLGELCK